MKVTFHVFEKSNNQQAMLHLCQLIESHYASNESVFIYTANEQDANHLDQLLWTYKEDSFIPHQLCPTPLPLPVLIGYDASHAQNADILVNITNDIPPFMDCYTQTVEIVFADPNVQQLARLRFKKYRDLGHDITTTKHP